MFQHVFPCLRARKHQCASAAGIRNNKRASAMGGAKRSQNKPCCTMQRKDGFDSSRVGGTQERRHPSPSRRQRQTEAKFHHVREISPGWESPPPPPGERCCASIRSKGRSAGAIGVGMLRDRGTWRSAATAADGRWGEGRRVDDLTDLLHRRKNKKPVERKATNPRLVLLGSARTVGSQPRLAPIPHLVCAPPPSILAAAM